MRYKTITFDANRPILHKITEPLNSTYGVAFRVVKNGEILDADISADNVAAEDNNGWKTAVLSTDSSEAIRELAVSVKAAPTVALDLSADVELKNTLPIPMTLTANISLSALVSGDIALPSEYVKSFSGVLDNGDEVFFRNLLLSSEAGTWCWYKNSWADSVLMERVDSITINGDSIIYVAATVPV